jgi:hypothetical protein
MPSPHISWHFIAVTLRKKPWQQIITAYGSVVLTINSRGGAVVLAKIDIFGRIVLKLA